MIKQLEVDGVHTLLAPTSGPMHAGLAFRVGQGDETLARRGITHLVEHLALFDFGVADHHFNGVTGVEHTYFHMQGSPAEITTFLTGVCTALRSLPMHRLAVEKEILRTEAGGRKQNLRDGLALWRFGARDMGLGTFPEWGLHALTPDDLQAWVAHWFTRENACLWVAGDEIPAGLRLDLPSGVRRPLPPPASALPVTPAFFSAASGAVAWEAKVRRSPAAAVYASVLERQMFRELRQEGGLSYTVGTDYQRTGQDGALITALADALPEKQEAVLGGMIDLLAAVRIGRIDAADVTAVQQKMGESLREADGLGARLPGQAFNVLAGRAVEDLDTALADLRAVTRDDVAAVAAEAYGSGLLMAPRGSAADWAGYAAAPVTSESAVEGTRHAMIRNPDRTIVVGPAGVSVVDSDGDVFTVRYDETSVLIAWPDGGRWLIGHDAIEVHVEPTLLADGAAAVAAIDAAVPHTSRVTPPARDAGQIPSPPDGEPDGERPSRAGQWLPPTLMTLFCLAVGVGVISWSMQQERTRFFVVTLVVACAIGVVRYGKRAWRAAGSS